MVSGSTRNWIAVNAVQQSSLNKNMTTLHFKKSIGRSPLRRGFLLIALALAWFALSPTPRAVNPPPDGGYPNQNTAEVSRKCVTVFIERERAKFRLKTALQLGYLAFRLASSADR